MKKLNHFQESKDPSTGSTVFESEYCRMVLTGHRETVLSFAAINCPPGKFFTTRVFAGDPRNIVFLNCPRNSWYLDGVPGLGDDLESAANGLSSLLDETGIGKSRKLCWGGSMGGYGAVAFGALLNADLVVATGAELELLVEGGNSRLILRQIQRRNNIPIPPLRDWVEHSAASYFLYCGEFAYHDLVSALKVADCPRVKIATMRDFGHPLPGYIERQYGLKRFLAGHRAGGGTFRFTNGEEGSLIAHMDWWSDLHAVSNGAGGPAEERLQTAFRSESALPSELLGHIGHALSLAESRRGNQAAALRAAVRSVEIAGHGAFLDYRLASAMRDSGRPASEWLPVAGSITGMDDPDRLEFGDQLVTMIHQGMVDGGDHEGASRFLVERLKRSSHHPKRVEVLGRLQGASRSDPSWRIEFTPDCLAMSMKVLLDNKVLQGSSRLLITGVMVPVRAEDHFVSAFSNHGQVEVVAAATRLPSPGVAKLFPDLPRAAASRFRLEVTVPADEQGPLAITGTTESGRTVDWFTLRRNEASA